MTKRIFKGLLALSIALITLTTNAIAQNVKPTNSDEYAYCTVGYKMELQMKLPMKKGYSLKDVGSYEDGERKMTFKTLYRDKENKPCAVLMIYIKQRSAPEYFCLPTSDAEAEIWNLTYNSVKSETENEEQRFRFMTRSLAKLSALLLQ